MSYSFVYLLINSNQNVLHNGVTSHLQNRMYKHAAGLFGKKSFTYRYNCIYLAYCEAFYRVVHAIAREKQVKGYSRKKKDALITACNPQWRFLSDSEGRIIDELDEYCRMMG